MNRSVAAVVLSPRSQSACVCSFSGESCDVNGPSGGNGDLLQCDCRVSRGDSPTCVSRVVVGGDGV